MKRLKPILLLTLAAVVLPAGGEALAQADASSPVRLVMSEVTRGSLASEQRCGLVFSNHRFHLERASLRSGRDLNRRVYEGEFSEAEWSALSDILENEQLQSLDVPRVTVSTVVEDFHLLAISIARKNQFQSMEFTNDRARGPYKATLKPLLQWWKSFSGKKMSETAAPANRLCALTGSSAGVFAQ